MRGDLFDEIVTIPIDENSRRPIALHEKSHFGNLKEDRLELSLIEAGYLMENNLFGKFLVYSDLKNRGYVIKTGFKYGSEFRLYDRGLAPGKGHSNYLVKVVYEKYNIDALDFASYVRVSHGVNKNLLLAVVDDDLDITYYNVEWTRP